MAQRQRGFDDDRRRSSYGNTTYISGASTYRPGELRDSGGRESRGERDRVLVRRDSDYYSSRGGDEYDKDREKQKAYDSRLSNLPNINTNVAKSPSKASTGTRALSTITNESTATASDTLQSSHAASTNSTSRPDSSNNNATPTSVAVPVMGAPKAKDPQLQPIFQKLWEFHNNTLKHGYNYNQKYRLKKEMEKHNSEAKHAMVKDFPSMKEMYQQIHEKDQKEDNIIKQRMSMMEGVVLHQIEDLAATIVEACKSQVQPSTTTPEVIPVTTSTSAISALEDKFRQFKTDLVETQQKLREQQSGFDDRRRQYEERIKALEVAHLRSEERIRQLEEGREASDGQLSALSTRYADLKEKQADLENEKKSLQKQVAGLQKDINQVDGSVNPLLEHMSSVQAGIDRLSDTKASLTDFLEAKAMLNGVNEQLRLCKDKMNHLEGERAHSTTPQQCQECQNLSLALVKLKDTVSKMQESLAAADNKIEDMDFDQVQMVIDTWFALGVAEKIKSHETRLSAYERQLRGMGTGSAAESSNSTPEANAKDLRIAVENIRKEMTDVETKVISKTNETISRMSDECGKMIEELEARIDSMERKNVHQQAVVPSAPPSEPESRAVELSGISELVGKVKELEDQDFTRQVSNLNTEIVRRSNEAAERIKQLKQDYEGRIGYLNGVVEAQRHEVIVVNDQLNQLFTKPVYDAIVQQVDRYSQRLALRADLADTRLKMLEDRRVPELFEQVQALKATVQKINAFSPAQKRGASPLTRPSAESVGKKRRVETNGISMQPLPNGSGASY
ncbi:hypothetical protein BX600DRAFT_431319 [Xylariales sp. PMI_506]|nr:hypothetical protein BX600DRAFT_431319 [Xylariales sp. PMI_506]